MQQYHKKKTYTKYKLNPCIASNNSNIPISVPVYTNTSVHTLYLEVIKKLMTICKSMICSPSKSVHQDIRCVSQRVPIIIAEILLFWFIRNHFMGNLYPSQKNKKSF